MSSSIYCGRRDPAASLQQSQEQRRELWNPTLHSLKIRSCDSDRYIYRLACYLRLKYILPKDSLRYLETDATSSIISLYSCIFVNKVYFLTLVIFETWLTLDCLATPWAFYRSNCFSVALYMHILAHKSKILAKFS